MTDDTQSHGLVSIGELARSSGIAVRTIRFYCDEGIVEARRSAGGHRMFEAETARERLLLVRRLRALGLGLGSIGEVVRGERSLDEVIAAESALIDSEFRALAWRRASVRAVRAAAPEQRAARLALLAAAQDGDGVHECLTRFWERILTPIPRREVDAFVGWNVPEPPDDPSVEQVVAYAELAALVTEPGMNNAVRQQLWRKQPERIRDPLELYGEVDQAMRAVVPLVREGVRPRAGSELDRFVGAHAGARGDRDSPRFRAQLVRTATGTDRRIPRYWALTAQLFDARITVGQALEWVDDALTRDTGLPGNTRRHPVPR